MKRYYNAMGDSPISAILTPWNNFTRASPVLWVFLISVLLLIVGLSVSFLEAFVWLGGFMVALFVAVAIAMFESL